MALDAGVVGALPASQRPLTSTDAGTIPPERSHRSMPSPATVDPREYIRDIRDFPKPGILFKDITPLLSHPEAFRVTIGGDSRMNLRAEAST